MSEIGILIAIIIGAIIAMVLLNKLLEYLFFKFPIPYNVILIIITLLSHIPLIKNGLPEAFPVDYALMQVLFFYLQWSNCDASSWTSIEGSASYNEYTDTIRAEAHEESHYRPGWWNKLVVVAFCVAVACVLTYFLESPILTLIIEILLPAYFILLAIRYRH